MSTNLTAFTYWPSIADPLTNEALPYPPPTFFQPDDSKSKIFRHPMFLLNTLTKQELDMNYDKTPDIESKPFLSPISTICEESEHKVCVKSSPEKARPYSCEECGKSFHLKHHLTTHARTHSGVRPHSCNHCGKSFTHKHCLNTHLLLHSSERPYKCGECKKSFTLKHHLITHGRVHKREKPFICSECGQAFPLKRHLITHSKFHAGERPFVCKDCGESFAQKDHLVMHSRFHGSINSFACTDCGATFTRKFELVNHGRLHGRQPLSCPICNKEFLQKRTLVTHMRYHSTQYPFICMQCGESFQTKNNLTEHLKCAHEGTNNNNITSQHPHKPHRCPECGCLFNTTEALALHIKLHTGDPSLSNDLTSLTMGIQHNNYHVLTNVGATPNTTTTSPPSPVKSKQYVCGSCSKSFSAKHGLVQHVRRHPNGSCALRSHICPTCNKGFFQKNHLLLHQRQHNMESSQKHVNVVSSYHGNGNLERLE